MVFNEASITKEELSKTQEKARPFVAPVVTEEIAYNLFCIFSIIIRVTDCTPDLHQGDLAKYYKTYVKAKLLFFVWDSHIKSMYKPILNVKFEFNWFEQFRATLRMFLLNLERRFNRRKYDDIKK